MLGRHQPLVAVLLAPLIGAAVAIWGGDVPRDPLGSPVETVTLLNASYDPTRELYQELNAAFSARWFAERGQRVVIRQSHGGSGKQARAVIDGLNADVVSLALPTDVDAIAARGLIAADWRTRHPNHSAPFPSTIVLVTRANNPKQIRDWGDLARAEVDVITPNPKTSGGARLNVLAAWAWAKAQPGASDATAQVFLDAVFSRVPVLDTGARGATTTFHERGLGDVLVTWESEARLLRARDPSLALVQPTVSVWAAPPVAVVDRVVDNRGTRAVAEAYLAFLYGEEAQQIAARHHFGTAVGAAARAQSNTTLVDVDALGGWAALMRTHFADGGIVDGAIARAATR